MRISDWSSDVCSADLCGYPALAADVVCVGSTDWRDLNAWYGNFPVTPSGVALMAPGGSGQVFCDVQSENVLSTYSTQAENACAYPAEGYRGLAGTSMASQIGRASCSERVCQYV